MANTARTQSKTITHKQTGQVLDRLSKKLRASGLPLEATQAVLQAPGTKVFDEMVAVFRRHVEAMSKFVTRPWKADRTKSPKEVLQATDRVLYVDDSVVAAMPRGTGAKGETVFFQLDLSKRGGVISDADLEKEFELLDLEPELPDNLADANRADPAFADTHPNCTHWKDKDGKWCCAMFSQWNGKRFVDVSRRGSDWLGDWWFAGRRKSALKA